MLSLDSTTRRLVILLALMLGVAMLPAIGLAQETGHEHHRMQMAAMPAPGAEPRTNSTPVELAADAGELVLVDSLGRARRLADVFDTDAPVLVNFIFTTCTTICPVMSAGFAQLDERLATDGRPVRLVSISIDPDMDTPPRLHTYAVQMGARPDWVFLTGTRGTIETVQRAFGAFRGSKESHTPVTFVRRTAGARWERLDGLLGGEALLRAYAGATETKQ